MTLQQLHQVITIAESRSMNEASRKLFVSQPNLSAVVRELEEEAGITIFIRSNRGIVLTPEGEEFPAGRGAVSFTGIPLYFVCIQKEIFRVYAALYLCGQGICGSGQGGGNGRI